MNGKKIACVVLMLILAGLAYGAQMMQKRATAMMEEAGIAKTDAENAENDYKKVDYEIKYLKSKTGELCQFLKDWEPTIRRIQSTQEAEQALQSIVRNSHIITLSQKSDTRENRESKVVPKILQGSLTVQDEYTKTMNWLGELERKIPLMRVTSCRFKQGETGRHVNLELRFDIPIVNRDAQAEETKPNG